MKQKRQTYREIAGKAQILFPVGMSRRRLNEKCKSSTSGGIYMASVLEYLSTEVFDVINVSGMSRITPETITGAIQKDSELNKLNIKLNKKDGSF